MFNTEQWRQSIGYNPYHFWQLSNERVPVTSSCNTIVSEYAWQSADAAGRSELRRAILTAKARLREHLGYRVEPEYVEKRVSYPRPQDFRMSYGWPFDANGRRISVNVDEGFIRDIGTEGLTLGGEPSVVYSDENEDGITDTFTLTVDLAGITSNPNEVVVFFATADRLTPEPVARLSADDRMRYQISPINVSFAGTIATITGNSWQSVRPIRYEGIGNNSFDPNGTSGASNVFAQTLEVYRQYTDTSGTTLDNSQAVLEWETLPCPCGGWLCCGNQGVGSNDPAAVGQAISRAGIRDARLGYVHVGQSVYNQDTDTWSETYWQNCRQPDRVCVRYLAGAGLVEANNKITYGGNWYQIVARLAAAELSRRICACDPSNKELFRWQFDMSQSEGNNGITFNRSELDLSNPLGTAEGQIYAWKNIKNLMITRAFVP